MRILILTAIALALSGCFTMRIHQTSGQEQTGGVMSEEWHHDGILGFVEFSQPVNMKKRCHEGWQYVEVQQTFLQGLISNVTYSMYAPWNVTYRCKSEGKAASLIEIPIELYKRSGADS